MASAVTYAVPVMNGAISPVRRSHQRYRRREHTADHALLHPDLALGQLAIGGETSELGAGPGSARRAIVRLARAQHEIPAVRAGRGRRHEHLDVVDLGMTGRVDGLPHAPGEIGERVDVLQVYAQLVALDEEEPVAAPRYVAADLADAGNLNCDLLVLAEAGHVRNRDLAVRVQHCVYRTDRGIDFYQSRLHLAGERQRRDEADGAVAAHAEIADVVEEDDAEAAVAAMRRAQERADDGVRAARLVDDCRTIAVEVLAEAPSRSLSGPLPRSGPPSSTSRVGSPQVCESITRTTLICTSECTIQDPSDSIRGRA